MESDQRHSDRAERARNSRQNRRAHLVLPHRSVYMEGGRAVHSGHDFHCARRSCCSSDIVLSNRHRVRHAQSIRSQHCSHGISSVSQEWTIPVRERRGKTQALQEPLPLHCCGWSSAYSHAAEETVRFAVPDVPRRDPVPIQHLLQPRKEKIDIPLT